jgi:hypothetical protein
MNSAETLTIENLTASFEELEEQTSSDLRSIEEEVLERYSSIKGKVCSIHSLHGTISASKSQSVDLIHSHWSNYKDFISSWLEGVKDQIATGYNKIMQDMIADVVIRTCWGIIFCNRVRFAEALVEC